MSLHYFLSATLAGMLLAVPAARAADAPADQCVAPSTASLDALVRGDYAGARKDFNATVSQALDVARLEQVWTQIQSQAGTYRKHAEPHRQNMGGHDVVVTPVSFANMPLDFVVACDDSGKISTFRFIPPGAIARSNVAPPVNAHVDADGVRVQPLAVTSPLGPLQGVLTLPAGKGPFPAVLLVAGSGPNDRDETIGPNKPFRDIADGLAAAGIASLRYDKRTHVYGAQLAGKPLTVDDEVTDDALSALRELGQQPPIDARRLFVLGHSLGALMAPRIGERDPQLAGLIMLAAPVRPLLEVIAEQTREQGLRHGLTQEKIAASEQAIAAEQQLLAKADPAHPPQGAFGGAPQSYWLSLYDYHQSAVAKALSMPMLILQGGSDFQVSPTLDFARWKQALGGRPHTAFHLYPALSHLFMPAGKTGTVADYQAPEQVDAHVIGDIIAWIKTQPPARH